ncbi:MAG: 2-hydroxychromene-2-carboxylate dehydrogenase [Sphingomonas bacterium]|nr:2-hydroxychromene-2-carboxylate dehydrogenase [Sphingomonas bacterium]
MTDWHLGDHLARASARAGLDLAELDAAIASDDERYRGVVADNQAAQRVGGHCGVPLMVLDDEPFFGQDHFDQFVWRLEKAGLKRRQIEAAA